MLNIKFINLSKNKNALKYHYYDKKTEKYTQSNSSFSTKNSILFFYSKKILIFTENQDLMLDNVSRMKGEFTHWIFAGEKYLYFYAKAYHEDIIRHYISKYREEQNDL